MKKITVIGLGYIGLPTALFFARAGFDVTGVDVNDKIVNELKNGNLTFEEPGLDKIFVEAKGNITFSTKPAKADLFIITVPTPFLENKTIDEKYINQAFEDISSFLEKGNSVVLESTVPPMITEKLAPKIESLGFVVGKDIYLAHVPETIIPGNMVNEFMTNKRLIGGATPTCTQHVSSFYKQTVTGEIVFSDMRTAEFVKVIENTYRDVNIALANELMHLSDEMNIDVFKAIEIANKHPRVNLHTPGPGVGGHCISVDPWFLVGLFGEKANIVKTARDINDSQPRYMYEKLAKEFNLEGKTVGVYGLAYKPNIDDFRESPSFTFIDILKDNNINYISYDDWAMEKVEENQVMDFDQFNSQIDIIVIYVAHDIVKERKGKFADKLVFEAMKI